MKTEKTTQQSRIRPGIQAKNLAEEYMVKSNLSFTEALDEGITVLKIRAEDIHSSNYNNPELSEKLDLILKALKDAPSPTPGDQTSEVAVRALGSEMQYKFSQFGDLIHSDHRVTFAGISKIAMEVSLLRRALNAMAADGTTHQKEMMQLADQAIESLNKNVKDFRIREGFEYPDMGKEWRQSVMMLQESRGGQERDECIEPSELNDKEHER